MSSQVFLASLGEQNIIWIFSNLGAPTFSLNYDMLSELVDYAQN